MIRHAALLLLLFASVAHGQGLSVYVKPMPIYKQGVGRWMTARANCAVTAATKDGPITFPAFIDDTPVNGVLRRAVAECTLSGIADDGHALHMTLPRERVIFGVAMPIRSTGFLTTPDGESHAAFVDWPACRTRRAGIGVRIADEITAVGRWMR